MPRKLVDTGEYAGRNTQRCTIGCVTMWFSYASIVAIWDGADDSPEAGGKIVVSSGMHDQKSWSQTTTQHINAIEAGPEVRLRRTEFLEYVMACIDRHGMTPGGDAE